MAKRPIIEINRELCNGCGLCTTACAEGALVLDGENKAVLVREIFCDGLGACLDVCPTGALKVVERESEAYDPALTEVHVRGLRGEEAAARVHGAAGQGSERGHHGQAGGMPVHSGCPGSLARTLSRPAAPVQTGSDPSRGGGAVPASPAPSELTQWPIQLHLVSPQAPYFNECDLLIAADCTAFSLGTFHPELLRGKKLVIACPKLDDTAGYVEKLAELLRINTVYSVTTAIMEVPCCSGLRRIVEEAVSRSGKNIAVRTRVVAMDGSLS